MGEASIKGAKPSMETFVALCSEQLKFAIDDSRKEMDSLTLSIVEGNTTDSANVITRLQSIDRLMQRLSNVQLNLDYLANYLGAGAHETEIDELMENMRSTFTMPSERELFDQMTGYQSHASTQLDDEMVLF